MMKDFLNAEVTMTVQMVVKTSLAEMPEGLRNEALKVLIAQMSGSAQTDLVKVEEKDDINDSMSVSGAMTRERIRHLWKESGDGFKQIGDNAKKVLAEIAKKAPGKGGYKKTDVYAKILPDVHNPDRGVSGMLSSVALQMENRGWKGQELPYTKDDEAFYMRQEVADEILKLTSE